MARITVEDCPQSLSRFELVALAAERGKQLNAGATMLVSRDNDKTSVVALREIAKGVVDLNDLTESVIRRMRQQVEVEEAEEEVIDFMNEEVAALQQTAAHHESLPEAGFHDTQDDLPEENSLDADELDDDELDVSEEDDDDTSDK